MLLDTSYLSFPVIHKVVDVVIFVLFLVKGKLISAKSFPPVGFEPATPTP